MSQPLVDSILGLKSAVHWFRESPTIQHAETCNAAQAAAVRAWDSLPLAGCRELWDDLAVRVRRDPDVRLPGDVQYESFLSTHSPTKGMAVHQPRERQWERAPNYVWLAEVAAAHRKAKAELPVEYPNFDAVAESARRWLASQLDPANLSRPMSQTRAASRLHVSEDTLRRRMEDGTIHYVKLSRQSFRFSLDDAPELRDGPWSRLKTRVTPRNS